MGRIHNSHRKWFRRNFIPGKVGQDEIYIYGSGIYAHQRKKNPKKGSTLIPVIPGVLHQYIQDYKPTIKRVHLRVDSWIPYRDREG